MPKNSTASETILVPEAMVQPGCFVMKLTGHCLHGDGLLEGDHVIVVPRRTAKSGDLVIVEQRQPDGSWYRMTKRYFPEGRKVRLQMSHPTCQRCSRAIVDVRRNIRVKGVITGLLRGSMGPTHAIGQAREFVRTMNRTLAAIPARRCPGRSR